jgi:hypothetical protein
MTASFKIVDLAELRPAQIVGVINEAFGRSETERWFEWKHRNGPWGPSVGVAAVDDQGPIGVRLLLPWRFHVGDIRFIGHRATEAATIPRAQGRGVFTALNRWMMEELRTELIFSTPNVKSRGGYLKLGWKEIALVPHRWEFALRPGRDAALPAISPDTLRTEWDADALQWRSDLRSGHRYLTESSDETLLCYRLLRRRGIAVVAPTAAVGDPEQAARLWRRMLDRTRARLVLRPATQPAPQPTTRLAVQRGESLILGWSPGVSALASTYAGALSAAPWSAADVEGVI